MTGNESASPMTALFLLHDIAGSPHDRKRQRLHLGAISVQAGGHPANPTSTDPRVAVS